jgi:hypothetical protein
VSDVYVCECGFYRENLSVTGGSFVLMQKLGNIKILLQESDVKKIDLTPMTRPGNPVVSFLRRMLQNLN